MMQRPHFNLTLDALLRPFVDRSGSSWPIRRTRLRNPVFARGTPAAALRKVVSCTCPPYSSIFLRPEETAVSEVRLGPEHILRRSRYYPMVHLHFGRSGRILFGSFDPGRTPRRNRGVVICNPWGVEALRAHRSIKALTNRLVQAGLDVLRFDYFGSGDSWGDGDATSLSGWKEDSVAAVEEIRAVGQVSAVDLVGLRLGAWAAAMATPATEAETRLVLWDPVCRGTAYLEDLRPRAQGNPPQANQLEVDGFEVPVRLQEELSGARLADLFTPGLDAAAFVTADALDEPCAELTLPPGRLHIVPGPRCWVEEGDYGAAAVPVEMIEGITEWLR